MSTTSTTLSARRPAPTAKGHTDLQRRVLAFLADLQRFEAETHLQRPLSRRGLRAPLRIADYERWATEQAAEGEQVVSWAEARLQLGHWKVALDLAELRTSPGQRHGLRSRADVDGHLRACADEHRAAVSDREQRLHTSDYKRYCRRTPAAPSLDAVKRWYGTWATACASIGVAPGCVRGPDDLTLDKAMAATSAVLGRAPSVKEYDRLRPAGSQSASALIRQHGFWTTAVRAAGLEPSFELPWR